LIDEAFVAARTTGKLVGAILLGDLAKAPFLTQAFDLGGPTEELGA